MYLHEEETPKSCCGVVVTQTVSIRWFIVMIAFVGICCVIVGTVLGAMKASGREHLTVSLLMIGKNFFFFWTKREKKREGNTGRGQEKKDKCHVSQRRQR